MSDSILTRAEVEHERKSLAELDRKFGGDMKVDCFVAKQSELLNTITQAVELLKKWDKHSDMAGQRYMTVSQHMTLKIETMEWLASYHAASSPPQPSPPQK